jgi:hypothetical protein
VPLGCAICGTDGMLIISGSSTRFLCMYTNINAKRVAHSRILFYVLLRPGLLNSLAGVLSTLANVLGVHHATFSVSSKSTIVVTTGITGICGGLTLFYMFFLIRNLKKKHDEEVGKQRAGKHGEGVVDVSKRKVERRLG